MAQRDLTTYNTVGNVLTSSPDNLMPMAAEIGNAIVKQSQEAKIAENLSSVQLELNKLQNEHRIKYEGDPFNEQGLREYKQARKAIYDKYGSNISPFFRRDWNNKALDIDAKADIVNQEWGYKQARDNTIFSINNSIKNNFQMASINGADYANGKKSEIEALADYAEGYSQLQEFGKNNIGETSSAKLLADYESDYMLNFVSGVSDSNPYKAKRLLNDDRFGSKLDPRNKEILNAHIDAKIKRAEHAVLVDNKLKSEDPAEWADRHGASLDDRVMMQDDPATATVIGSTRAKAIALAINNFNSVDDYASAISTIKSQYGNYTPNAVRDIVSKGKLSPEQGAALQLSAKDPDMFATEINLLIEAGKSGGEKAINAAYKDRFGVTASSSGEIDSVIATETNDLTSTLYNEDYNFEQVNSVINTIGILAKSYRIKNPSASNKDAVTFAKGLFDKQYKNAQMNGVNFRVPGEYDQSLIEKRAEEAFNKTELFISEPNKRIADAIASTLHKTAKPSMTADGKGIRFTDLNGSPVLDTEGNPVVFSFYDLMKNPTENEKITEKNREFINNQRKAQGLPPVEW